MSGVLDGLHALDRARRATGASSGCERDAPAARSPATPPARSGASAAGSCRTSQPVAELAQVLPDRDARRPLRAHRQRRGEQQQPAPVGERVQRGAGGPQREHAPARLVLADRRHVEHEPGRAHASLSLGLHRDHDLAGQEVAHLHVSSSCWIASSPSPGCSARASAGPEQAVSVLTSDARPQPHEHAAPADRDERRVLLAPAGQHAEHRVLTLDVDRTSSAIPRPRTVPDAPRCAGA